MPPSELLSEVWALSTTLSWIGRLRRRGRVWLRKNRHHLRLHSYFTGGRLVGTEGKDGRKGKLLQLTPSPPTPPQTTSWHPLLLLLLWYREGMLGGGYPYSQYKMIPNHIFWTHTFHGYQSKTRKLIGRNGEIEFRTTRDGERYWKLQPFLARSHHNKSGDEMLLAGENYL